MNNISIQITVSFYFSLSISPLSVLIGLRHLLFITNELNRMKGRKKVTTIIICLKFIMKQIRIYIWECLTRRIPHGPFIHLRIRKIWFFYQLSYMYNAIDLSLFEIYISLEMRINKYIFEFMYYTCFTSYLFTSCGRYMFLSILF